MKPGKYRIVQQYGAFRVESYSRWFGWHQVEIGVFLNTEEAEQALLRFLERRKLVVVKEIEVKAS